MIATLLGRCTAGKQYDSHGVFKASSVYRVLNDAFGVWCDFHAPQEERVESTGRYQQARMEFGQEYQREWVMRHFPDAVDLSEAKWSERLEKTLTAMIAGKAAIHEPELWLLGEDMMCRGDVFVRDDNHSSELGNFHYRVVEVKRSGKLRDYHSLQAAVCNYILGKIQGYTPERLTVVTKIEEHHLNYRTHEQQMNDVIASWRSLRAGTLKPEVPSPSYAREPWAEYALKLLRQTHDPYLIHNVGTAVRKRIFKAFGTIGYDALMKKNKVELADAIGKLDGEKLHWELQAWKFGEPVLKNGKKLKFPADERIHYFDIETCDDMNPAFKPHIYLCGILEPSGKYRPFYSTGHAGEKKMMEEFCEFVLSLDEPVLYTWTAFENETILGTAKKFPSIAKKIDAAVERFVDLKAFVEKSVFFPVKRYGVEDISRFAGFQWRQDDIANGMEAMTYYWDYVQNSDEVALRKVLDYNEDDCVAMKRIAGWLKEKGYAI